MFPALPKKKGNFNDVDIFTLELGELLQTCISLMLYIHFSQITDTKMVNVRRSPM